VEEHLSDDLPHLEDSEFDIRKMRKFKKKIYTLGYPYCDQQQSPPMFPTDSMRRIENMFGDVASQNHLFLMCGFINNESRQSFDHYVEIGVAGHNCFTLPACSGGPVIDLLSGKIIGMHRGGYDYSVAETNDSQYEFQDDNNEFIPITVISEFYRNTIGNSAELKK